MFWEGQTRPPGERAVAFKALSHRPLPPLARGEMGDRS